VVRRRVLRAVLAAAVLYALGACSTDPDTSLGNEFIDDLLGTKPGVVFQDTIGVSGDTVVSFNSLLANVADLYVGREGGYTRAIVLRPDFSHTDGDENRTVGKASLRMRLKDGEELTVRFYRLAAPYTEGDSLASLDTLSVIIDPDSNRADRIMTFADAVHPLPKALVQGWIRGDSASNGIAVVYQDDGNERLAVFDASEKSGTDADPPTIQVDFTDGSQSSYKVTNDATFVRASGTTPNLIVSDGFVRRVYFRVGLDELSPKSAVHRARIQLHVVPGSVSGTDRIEIYIPDSDDPTSKSFRTGQPVTDAVITTDTDEVEFVVTNAVLSVLAGLLPDNGFAVRFVGENADVRYVEFYTSANDSLGPRAVTTSSTPADYHP
jgi:hypothetical protein